MILKTSLRALLACFLFIISFKTNGQIIQDSLKRVLQQKSLSVESRVMTLGLLARATCSRDIHYALTLEKQALQLSRTLKDGQYKAFTFATLTHLYYLDGGNIAQAKQAADSALWYAERTTIKE